MQTLPHAMDDADAGTWSSPEQLQHGVSRRPWFSQQRLQVPTMVTAPDDVGRDVAKFPSMGIDTGGDELSKQIMNLLAGAKRADDSPASKDTFPITSLIGVD